MHYYDFNIGDYRRDTYHLTPMEHYIYRTLLDWQYLEEVAIPNEKHVLFKKLRITENEENELENVLREFFFLDENGWKNRRVFEQIEKINTVSRKKSEAGKLGGRPKNNNPKANEKQKKADGFFPESKTKAKKSYPEPITHNPEPNFKKEVSNETSKKPPIAAESCFVENFEKFWNQYPRKASKLKALEAFKRLKPTTELLTTMLEALKVQKQSDQWTREAGTFVPLPTTWLNQKRWLDEPSAYPKAKTSSPATRIVPAHERKGGEGW